MRILTNIPRLPESWRTEAGVSGISLHVSGGAWSYFRASRACDLVLVMGDLDLVLGLALLYALLPWWRRPIVALDLVLREPRTLKQRLLAVPRRFLLGRVDHFIHYFKDLSGYRKYYGIDEARSSFVWFKCNLWNEGPIEATLPEGASVVCAGKSLRDFDTFLAAVEGLPYPAAIAEPDYAELRRHGARFTRKALPANLKLVPQKTADQHSWRELLLGAKILVIPVLPSSLCASGISTYLDGMLLGRAVVISNGPGASDILGEEATLVPGSDPAALREAIRALWEDQARRKKQVEAGRALAARAGGEAELFRRLLETCARWHIARR